MYPQVLKNVKVIDKEIAQKDEEVLKEVERVSKKLGENGRILLRASGTEPLVRVMVEAGSEKECEECVDSVIEVMKLRKLLL